MLGFNEPNEPTPAKTGDEPARSKTLLEILPDLDLTDYYPSLHDVKPIQYAYCSTPQNKDCEPKQIRSQIYTSDTVAQLLNCPSKVVPRTSNLTMSTETGASAHNVRALQSSSPFCVNSDDSKNADVDALFDLRVSEPNPHNFGTVSAPMMPQAVFQTQYPLQYQSHMYSSNMTYAMAPARNSGNLNPFAKDSSVFMQYERVSQKNVDAAIQGLALELSSRNESALAQQDSFRQVHQATIEAQRRKTIEDCFTVAKLNPFSD